MSGVPVKLSLNGQPHEAVVEGRDRLVDLVRDAGLTGTHVGCDTGGCGACTVVLDGQTVRSCLVLAGQCDGGEVTTIEALGTPTDLHPVMEAFHRHHGLQCGFCTPGMVLSAIELLDEVPDPDEATVRSWLAGNICRCTGYAGIVAAVLAAAAEASAVTEASTVTAPADLGDPRQ